MNQFRTRSPALDAAKVREIRRDYSAWLGNSRRIADRLGVSAATVLRVARGKTWADVAGYENVEQAEMKMEVGS